MSVAAILGSAFHLDGLPGVELRPHTFETRFGEACLHEVEGLGREAWALFRHGLPHTLLPNQINYRAHAAALEEVGCGALLVTSSVGVLDNQVALNSPLLVADLLMPDNRLPDGTACTIFTEPSPNQGHLVLTEGLFNRALAAQTRTLAAKANSPIGGEVVFAYVAGPRTKTKAENRMWAGLGAQVNSMTLGPEVILANELEIPCVGLAVGHKHSLPNKDNLPDHASVAESLDASRRSMERLVLSWLRHIEPVPFANHIYRFDQPSR